ncbi:putative transmembrane protein [Gregarina niphandrodes]|uniref:Transmembrane protein n=1 Tax=Gregarina niphandrodes TaxID=110365 RepID=A0A023B0D4_GRENI|nr:putative transmembrane protein [Gregarina niphandrodes]EZG45143.1 putative transmembrane protein [Gregarina niphandrodes]|eukprot:XP_011132544.1 putative transmembrane protein [Gregarina niphandrodes]
MLNAASTLACVCFLINLETDLLRATVRYLSVLTILTSIWGPVLYPLLGENIVLTQVPIISQLWGQTAHNTTLSTGFMALLAAGVVQLTVSLGTIVLLPDILTDTLEQKKAHLASSPAGQRSRYDGYADTINLRDSVTDLEESKEVFLNDAILNDEIIRLLHAPFPTADKHYFEDD